MLYILILQRPLILLTMIIDLILKKLKSDFVKNYLKNRNQAVVINGSASSYLPDLSGVPQGSILGAPLFVLFLNDITFGLNNDTKIMMYADDTKI